MNEQLFDIIFRGDIVFGQPIGDVKARLAQLFKSDAAKIDSLFSGRPVPLKRGLDLASAHKYRDALLKAGALVDVASAQGQVSEKQIQNPVPIAPKAEVSGWTLAPVGSNLLQPAERVIVEPLHIDTSEYVLRPEGGYLLEPSERHSVDEPSVIAPNFIVAEAGAVLVRSDEKQELPLVEIDVGDWDIAALGEDLLLESEKPAVAVLSVPALDIGLAPVGSDLGQIKQKVIPVVPDITGICLVD